MIGERLGNWSIFKELGRGGMGSVYLAQEEMSGRVAAIKILSAELAQSGNFLKRFRQEIETLQQLDHPGIVKFYESDYEHGMYYYAMEYVEGESLEKVVLREKRLPWLDVLDIALQVTPALKHAHDHGVIHRDLKPGNLLRNEAGAVKLSDFGIAKVFAGEHLTATGGLVGTAEYISPEQAAGKPVSKRSDLYSLGVVLYVLLTGRPPFSGKGPLDLLHKHRYGQFDPPQRIVRELPLEMNELVCRLLEKDPSDRPADCLVLTRQLQSIRNKLARKDVPTQHWAEEKTRADGRTEEFIPNQEHRAEGPATLMSRLVRAELDRQNRGGPVAQFLNHPVVLVAGLVLCLGILAYAFFQPFSDKSNENLGNNKKPLANQKLPPVSAAEPLLRRAGRLQREGKLAEAKRIWQNVVAVFGDVPAEKEWVERAKQELNSIRKKKADDNRWKSVNAALKRAADLAKQGERKKADRIWQGIEQLYADDPSATAILDRVKKARREKK